MQLLGLDDYAQAERASDAGETDSGSTSTPDAGVRFDPKPPYLSGPECSACLEQACRAESAACTADAYCSSWFMEARSLAGPLATAYDLLLQADDARWASEHGGAGGWKAHLSLDGCAINHCTDACQIGRDLACVGTFDWPATYPSEITLRTRFSAVRNPALGFDDWRVLACQPSSVAECPYPIGESVTTDGGFAVLDVDLTVPIERMPEFNGYLRMEGGRDIIPLQLHQTRPFLDRTYVSTLYGDRAGLRGINLAAFPTEEPIDEDRGELLIFPQDCTYPGSLAVRSRGVTIEVWRQERAGFQRCTDCRVVYPGDVFYDPTLTAYSSRGKAGALVRVAPGAITIIVRDVKTRAPISIMGRLQVRAGTVHQVFMYPASRAELATVPAEALR